VAAIVIGAIGWVLNKKSCNVAIMSIFIDYMQVVSMFAHVDVAWPPEIKYLYHLMSVFNFNLDIAAPDCAIPNLTYPMKCACACALWLDAVVPCLICGARARARAQGLASRPFLSSCSRCLAACMCSSTCTSGVCYGGGRGCTAT
jgi:hypothetical protein